MKENESAKFLKYFPPINVNKKPTSQKSEGAKCPKQSQPINVNRKPTSQKSESGNVQNSSHQSM